MFVQQQYVPCLRWKMGEYQALSQLDEEVKDALVPLLEVPEIGFDFESQAEVKTIDEHLAPIAKRVRTKWGTRPCMVDVVLCCDHDLVDGRHPIQFVVEELRDRGCFPIPVTGISRDRRYQMATRAACRSVQAGMCIRISLEEALKRGVEVDLDRVRSIVDCGIKDCDLVLDLGAPNFVPVEGLSRLVHAAIGRLPEIESWRSFGVIGSSFPESMAEVGRGLNLLPRWEWQLYWAVASGLRADGVRIPAFGDYGINHPSVIHMDMRLVRPSASIRYTVDDAWLVAKGLNVRDHKMAQFRDLARLVTESDLFDGYPICEGDEYIVACANGGPTGNLTVWRRVGTSRHLAKVARDLASLSAA